jgi:hypothetical protein
MIWRLENKKPLAKKEAAETFPLDDKDSDGKQNECRRWVATAELIFCLY